VGYDAQRRLILGLGLKAARQKAGLTAGKAASLIAERGIRCRASTLFAWERGIGPGSREPFASDLAMIAAVYGCTVDSFYRNPTAEPAPGA
jgi:transcriptional regulator with XRE-family HTH domain